MALKNYFYLLLLFVPMLCQAMTYDNQFFPLGQRIFTRKYERYSNAWPDIFFTTANEARAKEGDMGIFEVYGHYDLNRVGMALEAIGEPNPVPSQFRGQVIPYRMSGKIQSVGGSLCYNQAIGDYVTFGAATILMNVKSWITFHLQECGFKLGPDQAAILGSELRIANQELGLPCMVSNQSGLGDIDTYLRAGHIWEYPYKCRRIDAGLRLGFLIPTGVKKKLNNPASVPFGGNGLAGIYLTGEAEFELKEDVKLGVFVRVSERFGKTERMRVPENGEPVNFGAVVGKFHVSPRPTFIFSPYLLLEDIRNGFGVGAYYQISKKWGDVWTDKRSDKSVHVNLESLKRSSSWLAEYFSVNMFYDFSKRINNRSFAPLVSLLVDVPVQWIGAQRVARTYRVSLGIEFNF